MSIRELRNHGGEIVDRAARGEDITITRAGRAVARLHAVPDTPLSAEVLLAHRRRLPAVDLVSLRADIDRVVDATL